MPKKDGINKTYSFSNDIIMMLEEICRKERRTQTNFLEMIIEKEFNKLFEVKNDKTEGD